MTYERKIKALGDGFVQYIDHMGDDAAIAQAARVSYAKGTKTVREDEKLVRFLMKHKHYSPFAMCQVKLHFRFPLFVNVQKLRHDRVHWNLMSARYSVMPTSKWAPTGENIPRGQGTGNKQVGSGELDEETQSALYNLVKVSNTTAQAFYETLLEKGMCREQARTVLPMGQYTEGFATATLGDWMLMLSQRLSPHTQYESRVIAEGIRDILKDLFPVAMQAFEDYQLNSVTFDAAEMAIIRGLLDDDIMEMVESPDFRRKVLSSIESKRDRVALYKKLTGA